MSQSNQPENSEIREDITRFLQANFPQIKMHGGEANITHIDLEDGEVTIQLGGACSGCGISPMTIQALKKRLPDKIPEINTVYADTGGSGGMTPSFPGETDDEQGDGVTDAPF